MSKTKPAKINKAKLPKPAAATAPAPSRGQFAIESWPTDKPIPYARNARKITPEAIAKVAASIQEFGWQQPIVVDEDNVILAGHTRLFAAQKLGLAEVPVKVAAGLTKQQAKAFRLADNRSGSEAKWDFELVALELGELKELGFNLDYTAFDIHEIEPLLAADWNPAPADGSFEENHQRTAPSEASDGAEPQDDSKRTIVLTPEQHELVGSAIFTLRERQKNQSMSDGRCLELIAGEWLANHSEEPVE